MDLISNFYYMPFMQFIMIDRWTLYIAIKDDKTGVLYWETVLPNIMAILAGYFLMVYFIFVYLGQFAQSSLIKLVRLLRAHKYT